MNITPVAPGTAGAERVWAEGEDPAEDKSSVSLATSTFLALQSQTHIYGGTVPEEVVAARRYRNRHARRARRGNVSALRRAARLATSRNRVNQRGRSYHYRRVWDHLGIGVVDAEVVEDE